MKKIVSAVMCLSLVFSMFMFGLNANAYQEVEKYYFNLNDNFVVISYQTYSSAEGYPITRASLNFTCYRDFDSFNLYGYYENTYPVYHSWDEVFEEFIPQQSDLSRYLSYNLVMKSITINSNYDENSMVDENELLYLYSKLNIASSFPKLDTLNIISDNITSVTPIIDFLLGFDNNITTVRFEGRNITLLDNRMLTDFPDTIFIIAAGNVCQLKEGINISYNKVTNTVGDLEYYLYAQPNRGSTFSSYNYISVREQYEAFLTNLQNGFVNEGIKVVPRDETRYIDRWAHAKRKLATLDMYYSNGVKDIYLGAHELYCLASGDPTLDGYVDAFDVAMATEYVNTFEEPEDAAVKGAMDIVDDGYIDATDLAYITYIANFEE